MKTKLLLISALTLTATALADNADHRYVAHEWGTFTSVQGADGIPLDWRPLESSELPSFVYDWNKPGGQRQVASPLVLTKAQIMTLQRMETPVIYFYAKQPQTVDVSVKFPTGLITEWYPQAQRIGPAKLASSPFVRRLDQYAHQVGANAQFSFASLLSDSTSPNSGATWSQVEILPPGKTDRVSLPTDASSSHYFAARETDANCLRVRPHNTNQPEYEKFIFYRGVGSFQTPLQVGVVEQNTLRLKNQGNQRLTGLFVLSVKNGTSKYMPVKPLGPGQQVRVPLSDAGACSWQTNEKLLQADLTTALVGSGLFQREAEAMVKTWRDSWFEEDGVRVLYVLPREWTDQTLPISFSPEPKDLVRVMVGRAEVLLPDTEQRLAFLLSNAFKGIEPSESLARDELRRLGRFAEPALRLALRGSEPGKLDTAMRLLHEANQPAEKL